jgi:branched-chain amino acid aminotransferase
MNVPLAYLNGRLVPFAQAALPLHDAGFVSGAAVVDNVRTFRHKLFRWPDHLARFRHDCAACYVPLEATDEQLTATAEELVAHNAKLLPPGGELQLVTFATPGPLGFYLGETANGPPTLGMVSYPLPFARYRRFFTEGVTLAAISNVLADRKGAVPPTVKHRSRMAWHVADHKAQGITGNPAALALAIAREYPIDYLTETSIANLLVVLDGVVVSPPPGTVLDGISLRVTRELCHSIGISVIDAPVSSLDVPRASEAMLTGTGFCLAGVKELYGGLMTGTRTFTWPGPVFRKLLAAWGDLVGVDIAKQFTENG